MSSMLWFTVAVYGSIGVFVVGYLILMHRFDPEKRKTPRDPPK